MMKRQHEINDIINKIKSKFKISNYGPIKYLLGITIEQTKFEYRISQTNFIENLLSNFKITQNKRTNTPCTLNNITNDKPFDPTTYKSVIGSLIYLAKCTRPDISFAVHHAARQCENPTYADWYKIINILKYLNNTKYYKILYNGLGPFHGYTDADFAGDKEDRKSTSGHIFLMGNSPISWYSKKQTIVATSTAEAEFISASECIKKALWFRNIIYELFNHKSPITIYTDNKSSKIIMENGEFSTKLKHIDIKFHFDNDNIKKNKIILKYKNTSEMVADILTKNINGTKLKSFTSKIFDIN